MSKKLVTAVALSAAVAVCTASLAADESPLAKLMEQIQSKTNAVRKATRTVPAYKKDAKGVEKDAKEIAKLAKDAKKIHDSVTKQKKTVAEWDKLMDALILSAGTLGEVAAKADSTQAQAKEAFTTMNKSCTACHAVFRVEDE